MRNPSLLFSVLALAALGCIAGCANPADQVPEATVGDAVTPVAETTPAPAAPGAAETIAYTFDATNSTVGFVGSKITGSHEGTFTEFTGTIHALPGNPGASSVQVQIQTPSLSIQPDRLQTHLKSADFFDVAAFPTAAFESTAIESQTGDQYLVTGNLTLHGVTKPISFPATIRVTPEAVDVESEFSIKRFDFDIVYKGKADDLIRDEVVIRLKINAPAA